MFRCEVFLTDDVIQENAKRVQFMFNTLLLPSEWTDLCFNKGCCFRFKCRNLLRRYRSHSESGDVDNDAVNAELPILQALLSAFPLKDQFNWDEFGLYYKLAPKQTIGLGLLRERKKEIAVDFYGAR